MAANNPDLARALPDASIDDLESGVRRQRSKHSVGARQKIVLVEDDPTLRVALEKHVLRGGWDVVSADRPDVAMALIVKEQPGLVVSDLDMPGMCGVRLTKLLRMALGDQAPPVVIVTGGDVSRVPTGLAVAVLQKPVAAEALHRVIRSIIGPSVAEEGV